MAIALPDSSDKTIIDVHPDHLGVRWTYGNLLNIPLGAFMPLNCNWAADMWIEIDGRRLGLPAYDRAEDILPVFHAIYDDSDGIIEIEGVGGTSGAIFETRVKNSTNEPHRYSLVFSITGPFGEVPGYINSDDPLDYMLAGWNDRADRVLAVGIGAKTPLRRDTAARTMALEWDLKPGETGTGLLVRPYRAYEEDVPELRSHDWRAEFEAGKETWRALLGKAARLDIPDPAVRNAYYACIGDIFIMREPVADGYVACSPGTEGYRSGGAARGIDRRLSDVSRSAGE